MEDVQDNRDNLAKMIVHSWDEHELFAAQAGLSKQYVLRHAGGIKVTSDMEKRAGLNVAHFKATNKQAEFLHHTIKADVGSQEDFSKHQHYVEYKKLLNERNQLAHIICEDSVLHRPFVKVEHLDWHMLESCAKEHSMESFINAEYEKIPEHEKKYFDNVARFQSMDNEHATLWEEVQRASKESNGVSSDVNNMIEAMKINEGKQGALALHIFDNYSSHKPFIELLQLDQEKAHKLAYTNQIQKLLLNYDETKEYKQCINSWMEFEKTQGWSVINDILNSSGISSNEFKTDTTTTRLTDLQKLTAETYGKTIKINLGYVAEQKIEVSIENVMDEIREKVVENYNSNTMSNISEDLKEYRYIKALAKEIHTELAAYQIIANNSYLADNNTKKVENVTEILDKEYEHLKQEQAKTMSTNVPINLRLKANRGLEQQQSCIAKTISILEPEREMTEKFEEHINLYDHNKQRQAKELATKQIDAVKSKTLDVFNKQEKPPEELIEVYNELQHTSDNNTDKLEEANLQQLSKAIAREIQANPDALILVKAKNMATSINKTAEIELEDDIVSQYKKVRDRVEIQRDNKLPHFEDSEALKAIGDDQENMTHLARVIEQKPELKADLNDGLAKEVAEHSKEYVTKQSNQINKAMDIEKSKGLEISYSINES